jgi:hydrogenase expression/formation protein HypC
MCLAIPMRVEEVDGLRGVVESSGVRYDVRLDLVGAVHAGEYVLIHAGYAIQVMDEAAAAEQLALLDAVAGDEPFDPPAPTATPTPPRN